MSIFIITIMFFIGYTLGRFTRLVVSLKDVYQTKEPPLPVPEPYATALKESTTTKARIVSPQRRITNDLSELDV